MAIFSHVKLPLKFRAKVRTNLSPLILYKAVYNTYMYHFLEARNVHYNYHYCCQTRLYGEKYHKATREIERTLVFYVNICLVWHLTWHALYRSQRWYYILRVKKSPRLLFQVEYNWSIQAWSSDTFISLPSFCWDQWVSDRHMIEI